MFSFLCEDFCICLENRKVRHQVLILKPCLVLAESLHWALGHSCSLRMGKVTLSSFIQADVKSSLSRFSSSEATWAQQTPYLVSWWSKSGIKRFSGPLVCGEKALPVNTLTTKPVGAAGGSQGEPCLLSGIKCVSSKQETRGGVNMCLQAPCLMACLCSDWEGSLSDPFQGTASPSGYRIAMEIVAERLPAQALWTKLIQLPEPLQQTVHLVFIIPALIAESKYNECVDSWYFLLWL